MNNLLRKDITWGAVSLILSSQEATQGGGGITTTEGNTESLILEHAAIKA